MLSALDIPAIRQLAVPVSVAQYHRMGELGLYDKRTELIRGVVIHKMTISPLHSFLVQYLVDLLKKTTPNGWLVRQEQPLTLADSEPETDIAVVKGSVSDYRHEHPRSANLAIEVCVSSEAVDRNKIELYAEAGVEESWLVLAEEKTIEVFSSPKKGRYTETEKFTLSDSLSPSHFPKATISLSQLFGS